MLWYLLTRFTNGQVSTAAEWACRLLGILVAIGGSAIAFALGTPNPWVQSLGFLFIGACAWIAGAYARAWASFLDRSM
jgi:hypothetical protein